MGPDLALALALADAADGISLGRFRARDLAVETKPDLTPVTEADRAVERDAPRPRSRASGRTTAILGEETAPRRGRRRWIVDPIDGTRNYSRGIPVWATLIALEEDGAVTLGVVSAPALGAAGGPSGAAAPSPTATRPRVRHLADRGRRARFAVEQPMPALAHALLARARLRRLLGHMLVAEGAVDGAIDAVGVTAGTSPRSSRSSRRPAGVHRPRRSARIDGGSAISSNGHLHAALLDAPSS